MELSYVTGPRGDIVAISWVAQVILEWLFRRSARNHEHKLAEARGLFEIAADLLGDPDEPEEPPAPTNNVVDITARLAGPEATPPAIKAALTKAR
jgi:hypothetical protein